MSNCDGPTRAFVSDADYNPHAVRYHVGCGGVYLRGYVNTDVAGCLWHSPGTPPHATTVCNYYAGLATDGDTVPRRRPTIADAIAPMCRVPEKTDKILAVQCLEHLGPVDAIRTLITWYRALAVGGQLVVSVPDVAATLDALAAGRKVEFHARHLTGTRTSGEYHHRSWYTRERLALMLECAGFAKVEFADNPHFYPAVVARAVK